ncbi:MAG TPA: ketol-acid reductoisomerase [Methanocorpusculum sp.]|nr:ketol-acid reductoisomerase [Methanocorpusculum sp.]
MLAKYSDEEVNAASFRGKTIAILGYGSQGRAQALNLRDAGERVIVGNRSGKSFDAAKADGFSVMSVPDAVRKADVLALMFPDESAAAIYAADIAPYLLAGQTLSFAHGFNIHYKFISPPADVDVILVAPKGVGPMVRKLYVDGGGVPGLVSVEQDASGHALETALAFAKGIGSGRTAVFASSFKDETDTDLFGEQAVICGGVPALIEAAYQTLVDAGYPEELAFSECAHEAKLVIDLIYEGGFSRMHDFVSKTASYGGITRGNRMMNQALKAEMKTILDEVQSGAFAREWMAEKQNGLLNYRRMVEDVRESDIEKTGREFRKTIWGK